MSTSLSRERGFSLTEVLLVMVLMVMLATALGGYLAGFTGADNNRRMCQHQRHRYLAAGQAWENDATCLPKQSGARSTYVKGLSLQSPRCA